MGSVSTEKCGKCNQSINTYGVLQCRVCGCIVNIAQRFNYQCPLGY